MAKKKKLLKLAENRPKTSCYTKPPAVLRVGHDLLSFYIPESLLQSLKDFSRSSPNGSTIDLVDVDAGTGHVIAHFLHTGTYQTLADGTKFTSPAKATTECKKAILSFVAAKKYGLTALQELARAEAVQCSEEISIVEVIQAANEDSLMEYDKDTLWFQNLMLHKADQAFNEDGGMLFTAKFFDNVKNVKLAKLLAQHITNHHLERVSMLRKIVATFENEVTAPAGSVLEDIQGKPLAVGSDELIHSQLPDQQISPEQRPVATLDKSASESYSSSTAGRVSEPGPEPEPASAPEPRLEPEVIEALPPDTPDPAVEVVETYVDYAASAAGSGAGDFAWESVSAAKTKTTRESSTALVEDSGLVSLAEPGPEVSEASDDDWGRLTFQAMKKKKKPKRAVEEEPPLQELQRDPVHEPVPQIVDPFAGLSKSQKKKLEKKMKEEAAALEKARQTALQEVEAEV